MKKTIKIFLIVCLCLFVVSLISASILIGVVYGKSKNIVFDKDKLLYQTSEIKVFDNSDMLTCSTNVFGRKLCKITDLNNNVKSAFISIEDKDFYKHNGLNYKRIISALIHNITSGKIVEGASTISQQLVKNTYLSNEKTLNRKLNEMFLTKKLEKQFSKDEILELYLNIIYFGNGCYGIEQASNYYFGHSANELSLAECATLAGVIKSPYRYSPIDNQSNCINRRNLVLKEMLEDKVISYDEYLNASNSELELHIAPINQETMQDSFYINCAIDEASTIMNMTKNELAVSGYKIYTYLDRDINDKLYSSIQSSDNYATNTNGNVADGLGIVLDNNTGGVVALSKNSEYDLYNLKRQPGSAIKPILVYSPAIENGLVSSSTQINDEEVNYNDYTPHNVGNTFSGYVSVKDCVAKSLNIPAIKLLDYVGIEKCKDFAKKCGITFNKNDNGLAIALGGFTDGITLQELATSYLPFSRLGNYVRSGIVRKITSASGVPLYIKDELGTQVFGSDTAYLMTDLLINGVKEGTSKKLNILDFDVAGKTGTVAVKNTNLNTDAISVAYTTKHTFATWLGNYTYNSEYNLEGKNNGGTYATKIICDTMQNVYSTLRPNDFATPDSVEYVSIDTMALDKNHIVQLASDDCPEMYVKKELVSKRFVPTTVSNMFSELIINNFNIVNNNENAKVYFNAVDYLSYNIYCNDKLIDSVSNFNGTYEYVIDNLNSNTMYTIYIEAIANNSNSTKSKSISIITKNKYDQMLENEIFRSESSNSSKWYLI